jgi:hypothetical protein
VPRARQGAGRHDAPEHYGALYASASAVSAVAERLAVFRGQEIDDDVFVLAGERRLALATIDDDALEPLVDLDDPAVLAERGWRPSEVARRDRDVTRPMALAIYRDGHEGLSWWSTIEAAWTNVTLFAERARGALRVSGKPEPLTMALPLVAEAADAVGIRLRRGRPRRVK